MMEHNLAELSAQTILGMPRDTAAKAIDAIIEDWEYWLKRANELFVRWKIAQKEDVPADGQKED